MDKILELLKTHKLVITIKEPTLEFSLEEKK